MFRHSFIGHSSEGSHPEGQYGKYFFVTGGEGSVDDAFRIEMDSINSFLAMSLLNEGRRNHGCTRFVDSGVTKVIILVFNG